MNVAVDAQDVVHYSFRQGLPSDFVYQSCKRDNGLLYIATQKGIVIFDGYRFLKAPYATDNTSCVFLKGNRLFYHDYTNGLACYDLRKDSLEIIAKINYEDSSSANDHYDNLFADSKNKVWCTDFNAVKYFVAGSSETKRFVLNPANTSCFQAQFYELSDEVMLLVSSLGVYQVKVREGRLTMLDTTAYTASLRIGTQIYLLSGNTLYSWDMAGNTFRPVKIFTRAGPLDDLCAGPANTLILNSRSKIFSFDPAGKNSSEIAVLEGRKILSMNWDTQNELLWVATNKGITRLRNRNNGLQFLEIREKTEIVTAIAAGEEKKIWVAGDHFLGRFDALYHYESLKIPAAVKKINALSNEQGTLLLSTDAGLFFIRDKKLMATGIRLAVKKTAVDAAGNYWILDGANQVHVYDHNFREQDTFLKQQEYSFWTGNVWNDLYIDAHQQVWLAGYTPKSFGIALYDRKQQKFKDIAPRNKKEDFIGDYYNRIAAYDTDQLLFSGYGGYNVISTEGKITAKFDKIDHRIENVHVEGIYADKNRNVLFATAEGLHQYNSTTNKVAVITEIDGLLSNDLIYGFAALPADKIAIGALGGVMLVAVDTVLKTKLRNRLLLTAVKINDSIQRQCSDTIVLKPGQHSISLLFSALNYEDPERTVYEYRINKGNWISLGHDPELSFNHMEHGEYVVEIIARDNLGNEQEHHLNLYIVIRAPFYQTLWFNIIVLLIVIAAVGLIVGYIFSRKRKIDLLSAKVKEVEMQILRSQMNPHFLFNSLNSIKGFILENKTEIANAYLTKFSRLMRNILENSRKRMIPLEKELQTLEWYIQLEAARLEHSFEYRMIIEEGTDIATMMIPPLIIQPFVENAIWHGLRLKAGNGLLRVVVRIQDNTCSITITDNGIGRAESKKTNGSKDKDHQSVGIDITRERLLFLNARNRLTITDLLDEKQQPSGTSVELIIFSDYD